MNTTKTTPAAGASRHTPESKMVFGTNGSLFLEINGYANFCFEHVNGKAGHLMANRVAARYNACAGMADPAAEIAALREALRECETMLADFAEDYSDHGMPELLVRVRAALGGAK